MKSVVFDVGNVLLDWNAKRIFADVFANDEETQKFLSEINFADWNVELDRTGTYDIAINSLIDEFPAHAEKIRMLDTHWLKSISGAIESSVVVLEALKAANIPLYAITNFSAEKWILACEHFAFLETSFIDTVVSAKVELIKPDPKIFQLFLNRNNLRAQDCIFIDDSKANIVSAQNLGFETIHFNQRFTLATELRQKGIDF